LPQKYTRGILVTSIQSRGKEFQLNHDKNSTARGQPGRKYLLEADTIKPSSAEVCFSVHNSIGICWQRSLSSKYLSPQI